jgi:hydrogenase expression/formation protein HypC
MCLAIPGKLIGIDEASQPRMGTADFGGIQKLVCLELVPDARVGEYVIVHVGFAISKLDEEEAIRTLKLFEEMEGGLDGLRADAQDGDGTPPAN